MEALSRIEDSKHVEEEWLHIVVEGFVIEEELGQDAELLTVEFGHLAVHLEDGYVVTAVNLIAGGVVVLTLGLWVENFQKSIEPKKPSTNLKRGK